MWKVAPAAALLLFTYLLGCDGALRVPKILHRNFMAGEKALYEAVRGPDSGFKAHWLASCKVQNPDWHEIVWDAAAVMALIEQDFPWFMSTYLSYPKLVQRSDVARYMVLYKHGGVYLDADVECYGSLVRSLQDKDLVLNCEWPEKQAQIHNAVMASAPQNPFWLKVLKEAMIRSPAATGVKNPATAGVNNPAVQLDPTTDLNHHIHPALDDTIVKGLDSSSDGSFGIMSVLKAIWAGYRFYQRQLMAKVQQLWEASPFHDKINAVLWSTGPMLLTKVYKEHIGGGSVCGRSVEVDGFMNHVYELGSWFTPCFFKDIQCQRRWITQHFLLGRNQTQQQQQQVVGNHHYSGSWIDWGQETKQQQQQQQHTIALEASQHVLDFLTGPLFIEYNCSASISSDTNSSSSDKDSDGSDVHDSGGSKAAAISGCLRFLLDTSSTETCAVITVVSGSRQQADDAVGFKDSASTPTSSIWTAAAQEELQAELCDNTDSTVAADDAAVTRPHVFGAAAANCTAAAAVNAAVGGTRSQQSQSEDVCQLSAEQQSTPCPSFTTTAAAAVRVQHDFTLEQDLQQSGCFVTVLSSTKLQQATAATTEAALAASNADSEPPVGPGGTAEESRFQQLHSKLGVGGARKVTKQQQQQQRQQQHQNPNSLGHHDGGIVDMGVVTLEQLLPLVQPKHGLQRADVQEDIADKTADAVTDSAEKHQTPQARYIVRLICDKCNLNELVEALDYSSGPTAGNTGPLQQLEMLLLDLYDVAGAEPGDKCTDGHVETCSSSSSNGPVKQSMNSIVGLDALYDLLYQQYGFKGFYREVMQGRDKVSSILRLGWVRQPHRLPGSRHN